MKTTDYLAEAFKRSGASSKAQFAKHLGVNRSAITMYESGERVMDDFVAAQIADLLEIDSMIVIAQANAEREKDESRRAYWVKKGEMMIKHAACVALAAVLLLLPAHENAAFASSGYSTPRAITQIMVFLVRRRIEKLSDALQILSGPLCRWRMLVTS